MNVLDWIVIILVVIGGLNWGLIGFFKYDLVAKIFGDMSMTSRIIYDIVGLAALYQIIRVLMMSGAKKPAAAPTAPSQPTI